MHRIDLNYTLARERNAAAVQHPLFTLLDALHRHGSISAAARELALSYRHVWGELKRWEAELGRELVIWAKGQPATLTPFGEKLLWAERRAQAQVLDAHRAVSDAGARVASRVGGQAGASTK